MLSAISSSGRRIRASTSRSTGPIREDRASSATNALELDIGELASNQRPQWLTSGRGFDRPGRLRLCRRSQGQGQPVRPQRRRPSCPRSGTLQPRARHGRGECRRAEGRDGHASARGRTAREADESHAERADPIGILRAADATRQKELVPLRYGRMRQSPFTFYRGSATIMAADLAHTLGERHPCPGCGDCHPMEFRGLPHPSAGSFSTSTTSTRHCGALGVHVYPVDSSEAGLRRL